MPYLGTPAAIGFSKTTKDRFSGDNSTTGFTMSQAAGTGTDIQVFVDNIRQEPTVAYSVSGATLTFTEAPPTGTNNVYVIHQHQALGTGTLPPQDLGSKDYIFGDDISLNSDASVINMGLDSEIKITHVHNTGILLTDSGGTPTLQLHDSNESVSSDGSNLILTSGGTAFKLPTADGTASGQVLQTDASGNLSFATIGSGGSLSVTGTTPTLTIGDAGAEDTKIVFDGNAQDFHIGLDDSADDLVIGLGSTLGTTTHIAVTENGHITKPLQPSFYVDKTDSQQTIPVNADTTINFNTERYDTATAFASNTFTAPVTGKYFLNTGLLLGNPPTDASYMECAIVTSNRRIGVLCDYDAFDQTTVYWAQNFSCVVDMDANDTAVVRIYQAGGVENAFVFHNSASTYFTGILIG